MNYYTNDMNQQRKAAGLNRNVDFNRTLSEKRTGDTKTTGVEEYAEYLRSRYGGNIIIQNVGKDQKSFDAIGAGTAGTGNVVIAPNILEEMANNPEKAAYYEEKIQYYYDSVPRYQAELSAMGHEIHSSGIIIHPDGTVTHYISGDLKPEVRAKIEAQIKAEREEKANRRQEYLELSQEAEEKRRQLAESNFKQQILDEALNKRILAQDMNIEADLSNRMSSAVSAYETAVTAFSDNIAKKI